MSAPGLTKPAVVGPVRRPPVVGPGAVRAAAILLGTAMVLALGALVGSGHFVAAGVITAGFFGSAALVIAYVRTPFWTVGAFWLLLLVQDTVSNALGKSSAPGTFVNQLENPIISVLLLASLFLGARRVRARWLVYVPAVVFVTAGLVPGVVHQVPPKTMFLGALLGAKLWAIFVICLRLPWDETAVRRVVDFIITAAVPVAVLAYVDFVAPGPFRALLNLSAESDVRLGLQASRSIFPNPALLSSFMFLSLAVLLARMTFQRRQGDVLRLVGFVIAAVLSLRFKALLGCGAAVFVILLLRPRSFGRRLGPASLVAVAAVAGVAGIAMGIASRQLSTYATVETPRDRLLDTSVDIATDHFPFGVGFGRFGSAPSGPPYAYSPVYDRYGLALVPGLSREKPDFLHDTSWPTVLGETGVIGWVAFAGGLTLLGLVLFRQAANPDQNRAAQMVSVAAVASLVAFLFDTAGRPALFDAFTVLSVGLVVGPALALGRLPLPKSPETH